MADEAFALSPISARGASPTETDYEAIREAFMETARGRWFLSEYAKRNRNSDTTIVLAAVARLEAIVALQKQAPPPAIDGVSDTVDEIIKIIDTARQHIDAVLGSSFLEEALGPSRKSARIIQEIAWGLRESGADSRISNILDGQVESINAGCERLAAFNVRDDVLRTFDEAREQIEKLSGPRESGPEAGIAENVAAPSHHVPSDPVRTMDVMQTEAATGEEPPEMISPLPEVIDRELEAAITHAALPVPSRAVEAATPEIMSAIETALAIEPSPAIQLAPAGETIVEPESKFEAAIAQTHSQPSIPHHAMSLGESLIASGIIAKPAAQKPDPLAPFRRMAQAEKIAFFS